MTVVELRVLPGQAALEAERVAAWVTIARVTEEALATLHPTNHEGRDAIERLAVAAWRCARRPRPANRTGA